MKKKVTFGSKPSSSGARKSPGVPSEDAIEPGVESDKATEVVDEWVAGESPGETPTSDNAPSGQTGDTILPEEPDNKENTAIAEPRQSMSNGVIITIATLALMATYGIMQWSMNNAQARHASDITALENAHTQQLQVATKNRETLEQDYQLRVTKLQGQMEARADASEKARQQVMQRFSAESQQLRATLNQSQEQYEQRLQALDKILKETKAVYEQRLINAQQDKTVAADNARTTLQKTKDEHVGQMLKYEIQTRGLLAKNEAITSQGQQLASTLQENIQTLNAEKQTLQSQIEVLQQAAQSMEQSIQTAQTTQEKQQAENAKQLQALQAKLATTEEALAQQNLASSGSNNDETLREARAWFNDGAYQNTRCMYQ